MTLRDLRCNKTLTDEGLAMSLGLKGKEIEQQIQGVNAEKTFTLEHIKNCELLELEEKE